MQESIGFNGNLPKRYDKYLGPFLFDPYARDIIQRIEKIEASSILEIACGTGRVTRQLIDFKAPETKLIATDLSVDMLKLCDQIDHDDTVSFLQADVHELPFENEQFDLIICQFGMMFFKDIDLALSEIRRVLKPGGTFIFSTWDKLENNPVVHTARQFLDKNTSEDLMELMRFPFRMNNWKDLYSLMYSSSFKDIMIASKKLKTIKYSPLNIANGLVLGSALFQESADQNPEEVQALIEATCEELIKEFGAEEQEHWLSAFVCMVRK